MVVETETDRDWAKVVETETLTRLSLFSVYPLVKYNALGTSGGK